LVPQLLFNSLADTECFDVSVSVRPHDFQHAQEQWQSRLDLLTGGGFIRRNLAGDGDELMDIPSQPLTILVRQEIEILLVETFDGFRSQPNASVLECRRDLLSVVF
jgi:hypothetical protein